MQQWKCVTKPSQLSSDDSEFITKTFFPDNDHSQGSRWHPSSPVRAGFWMTSEPTRQGKHLTAHHKSTFGGEMKRPHTLAVPKWAQGKSGLHQTASTTLTHVASADALLVGKGSRLCNHSYRTHPCRPRSSSSSSSWYVESAHSKEKEKNKLGEKKIVNFAILLSVVLKSFNLQSQELEAVFLKVEPLDFVFHLLWSQWMIGVKWMCSRQALWTDCSLSVGQRWDSFRSRSDEAVPLLCLSLSFKGRGQEPWPHFLLGLLTSIPLSVRMRMGSGDAAHLAAVISNRLHPPPQPQDYYMWWWMCTSK